MNVYYDPEKFGLTPVGEVEWTTPCYDYDTSVVWRTADGLYRAASDAGCSCPTPFESYALDTIDGPFTAHEVMAWLQGELDSGHDWISADDKARAEQQIARIAELVLS